MLQYVYPIELSGFSPVWSRVAVLQNGTLNPTSAEQKWKLQTVSTMTADEDHVI